MHLFSLANFLPSGQTIFQCNMKLVVAVTLLLASQFALAVAPVVSITAPANNSRFGSPASMTISANASNAAGATVSKVEFYRGKTLIGTDTTAPWSVNWNNATTGSYSITAKASNSANQSTTSAAVVVVVNNPPVISLTAPINNTSVAGKATVNLTATASDADGSISKVEFLNDTTVLGSDSNSPYSFSWANVAPGSYSLTARATDNLGGITTSTPVMFTVSNPLSISLSSPAANSVFAPGSAITLSATASTVKAGTSIAKVEFFQGSTLLNSDTSAPYDFIWPNVSIGTYSLTAKVTDSQGLTQTSVPINIEVKQPGTPPTVSIASPANNSSFIAPASIDLTANATANASLTAIALAFAAGPPANSISKVEYYRDGQLIGMATAAPYGFTWTDVAAGSYGITAKATDANGLTQVSAPITVQVNGLPSVAITAPAGNIRFVAPANIAFAASASAVGAGNSIVQVAWYQDETLLGTASPAPYGFTWPNVTAGSYSITAKATDSKGLSQISSVLNLIVDAPPTISLNSPADNSTFIAPASINLGSNPVAIGAGNSVVKVDYFQGTTLIASATMAPWSASWNNVGAGSYHISAQVTDNLGNIGSTAPVAVIVTDKSVNLVANPAFATAPASVTLDVGSNIAEGSVTKVEILNGDTVIATLTAAPFSFVWDGVPVGSYVLRARLTDNLGAVIVSGNIPVSITTDSTKIYDIHVDHLGTPRMVTDATGNNVWEWVSTPFGETAPNQNPGNTGAANDFELNLRFPGQVADRETGVYYNYFRDYDPQTGRYLQSDLIGLAGGINLFAYAAGNPVTGFDPFGLAPGDPYPTVNAAGIQAIKDINSKSISEGVEYAGRIYRLSNGLYSYTEPKPGTKRSSNPGYCPSGTSRAGRYHTHGADDPAFYNEDFSDRDKDNADDERVPSFLGTPNRFIKIYVPTNPVVPRGGTINIIGVTK